MQMHFNHAPVFLAPIMTASTPISVSGNTIQPASAPDADRTGALNTPAAGQHALPNAARLILNASTTDGALPPMQSKSTAANLTLPKGLMP